MTTQQERLPHLVRSAMVSDWKSPPQSPSVQTLVSKAERGIAALQARMEAGGSSAESLQECAPKIDLADAYALLQAEDYTDAVITEACGTLLARNVDRSTALYGMLEAAVAIRTSRLHSERVKMGILQAARRRAESESHSERTKAGIAAAKAKKTNP